MLSVKTNTPEPSAYSFAALDPMTGKLRAKLEKITAVYQKPKGKTTTTSVYTIAGTKSPIRLKIAEAVFEVFSDQSTSTLNPSLYISLYKINSGKNNRTLTMTPEGSDVMSVPINIQTEPYSYRVIATVAMLPGEYAFIDKTTTTTEGNLTIWTFGID
jgi:hypothetical protein